jgi:hypothetical protein
MKIETDQHGLDKGIRIGFGFGIEKTLSFSNDYA